MNKNGAKALGMVFIMKMVFLTACNLTIVSESEAAVEVVEDDVAAEVVTPDNETEVKAADACAGLSLLSGTCQTAEDTLVCKP